MYIIYMIAGITHHLVFCFPMNIKLRNHVTELLQASALLANTDSLYIAFNLANNPSLLHVLTNESSLLHVLTNNSSLLHVLTNNSSLLNALTNDFSLLHVLTNDVSLLPLLTNDTSVTCIDQ